MAPYHTVNTQLLYFFIISQLSLFCQIELVTKLVRLDVFGGDEVAGVYRLLVDDSHAIRHAAAELVANSLGNQGARYLAQVGGPGFVY